MYDRRLDDTLCKGNFTRDHLPKLDHLASSRLVVL
jgi:hypothetical protein